MENRFLDKRLIPNNDTGKAVNLEQSVVTTGQHDALELFKQARLYLQQPHLWQQLTGKMLSASFELMALEERQDQLIRTGDYIKINIPGPGTVAGEGYDWVKVKDMAYSKINNHEECFGILLTVAANPHRPEDGAAHFFENGATSTFMLSRSYNTVCASYHGRNEQKNTHGERITDNIRNSLVATGALAGLSEFQWLPLLKGLLREL